MKLLYYHLVLCGLVSICACTASSSPTKHRATGQVTLEEFHRFEARRNQVYQAHDNNSFDRTQCLKLMQSAKQIFAAGRTITGEVRKRIDNDSVGTTGEKLIVSRLFGTWPPGKRWYYSVHIEYSENGRIALVYCDYPPAEGATQLSLEQMRIVVTLSSRKGRHFLHDKVKDVFIEGQRLAKGYEDVLGPRLVKRDGKHISYAFGANTVEVDTQRDIITSVDTPAIPYR